MPLNHKDIEAFRSIVREFYRHNSRSMPWRDKHGFYDVLVSEMMLQQTQVPRVIPKFQQFMDSFPTIEQLAKSQIADVLQVWQGLGYNRRAKYLLEAAKHVVVEGIPSTHAELESLPGIGRSTASAIEVYVYDRPVVFVETNIRTVFFHHFFEKSLPRTKITDTQIVDLVARTLPSAHYREWYWALMDYGTYLKSQGHGRISNSAHYRAQTKFEGSVRQMRGYIIRRLTHGPLQLSDFATTDTRFAPALEGLLKDRMVEQRDDVIGLTGHQQES